MAAKLISQKKFAKLVSTTSPLAQPPGAITRVSNLLFTTRGSLQIADGSRNIANTLPGDILSLAVFSNNLPGSFPFYLALSLSTSPSLADVTNFDFTTDTGTLNPSNFYTFGIVALLGTGHTNIDNSYLEKGIVDAFDNVMFTWTPVAGATSYQIWVYAFAAFEGTLLATIAGGGSSSYTYSGVVPGPGMTPAPFGNTTLSLQLFSSDPGVPLNLSSVTAGKFPALAIQPASIAPGSPQFNPAQAVPGYSPYGGLVSVSCPIPQIVQFAGRSILVLGNGIAPQQFDPSLGSIGPVAPLINTFQAAYPSWQAGVSWITGSQLAVLNGGVNYLFTAAQGGVSGSGTPSWKFTTSSQTPDGSVIWTCNGPIIVSISPLGAAHAVAYAGSLWLANTYPKTTSYPAWTPTNTYVAGQQISVTDGSGNQWLFQVQIGGVSGSTPPPWVFTIGSTTTDGTVTWLCILEFKNAAGIDTHDSGSQTTNGSGNWSFVSNQWRSNFNPGSSALADLVFEGFGFSIPPTATVLGVIVTVGLVSQSTTTGTLSQVALYYMNAPLGTTKTPGTSFTTTITPQSYGSSSDQWGATLTPAIINDPSFGFALAANLTSSRVFIAMPFQVTVYYTTTASGSSALVAGLDGPTCIKMSDANNPNSWNPVNVAFIGRDDGTQITGMQPFTIAALGISPTASLCVFKEFTTYQVIGVFGSTTFEIQPAQTNLGCLAARSIQFIPGFGVCRFSHLGFAVFDGINDRLISEDIRPYLFGGVDSESDLIAVDPSFIYRSVSAQTTLPPMYMCAMPLVSANGMTGTGALTRLFCYDLVMKSWTVLDLPWAIDSLASLSVGEGYPLILAGKTDGTIQRLQAGDVNWDQGDGAQAPVAWSFRSPDVFGEGSSQKLFFEQVSIRGYGSPAMVASIIANLWMDGQQIGAQAIDIVPQGGSNLFEARVKIFRSGYRVHLDVSGNNGNAAGTIDALDWSVSPKSSLARRIIS